jgi:tetratricopeptide (TPR) repeat protein
LASVGTTAAQNDAIAHYNTAIALDPAFARAYAGMAITYLSMVGTADRAENMNQAKLLAEKAERMNPLVAEAHTVLGVIAIRDEWNAARGEAELRRALELDPNNAANHAYLAELLADEGHANEALHEVDVARTNDPLWPYINAIDTFVSGAAHQYDRGVDAARRNVAMAPNSSRAHDQLAWSLFDAGRYEESIGEWRATAEIDKDKARMALEDRGLAEFRRGGATAYATVRMSSGTHLSATATTPSPRSSKRSIGTIPRPSTSRSIPCSTTCTAIRASCRCSAVSDSPFPLRMRPPPSHARLLPIDSYCDS